MNISFFNKTYTLRRYSPGGVSFEDSEVSIHLHPDEQGGGQPWSEEKGIVRRVSGHGNIDIREADLVRGTKADRVFYRGRWYECVSSVLYDHTLLNHFNYHFISLPEDAVDTITVFNAVLDTEKGYDTFVPTVIKGVSWLPESGSTVDQTGIKAANRYTIQVPEEADFSGKMYVDPAAFTGEAGTFTFRNGDVIVNGIEEEPCSPSALKKKYRNMVTILGAQDYRQAPNARHWKVVGE